MQIEGEARRHHNCLQSELPENSLLYLGMAYVPVIGSFVSTHQQNSLNNKIRGNTSAPRLIKLIQLKNQYKCAKITSELFVAVVCLVVCIATFSLNLNFNFFTGLNFFLPMLMFEIVVDELSEVSKNNAVINELQSTGFREGMRTY